MSLLTSLANASIVSGASSGGTVPILSASMPVVEEGGEFYFTLYFPGGVAGTTYPYTITGISQEDLFYGTLTGNFTLDSVERAQVNITLARDSDVEVETITMTVDSLGLSVNVTIDDTSIPIGEISYIIPGTYSWTCPTGITSVSAIAIGAGGGAPYWTSGNTGGSWSAGNRSGTGGGGGACGYTNNIAVTPGQTYSVVVGAGGSGLSGSATSGGLSYFNSQAVVSGSGGLQGNLQGTEFQQTAGAAPPAAFVGDGGAAGGWTGNAHYASFRAGGGGGAGGYGGNGGAGGGAYQATSTEAGGQGIYSGGGGGAYGGTNGRGGAGGGSRIFGRTSALSFSVGVGGAYRNAGGQAVDGKAYSLSTERWDGLTDGAGTAVQSAQMRYGAGSGASNIGGPTNGSSGAVRIMWGPGRSFPDNAGYLEWSDNVTVTSQWTLINPNAYGTRDNDAFGVSVAMDGNYAIVGALFEDAAGSTDSGKAYIFNVTTGAVVHTLDNPNAYGTSTSDHFGSTVAISGNYAIVGAYQEDDATGDSAGAAYIFDVPTGALLHTLTNPNPFTDTARTTGTSAYGDYFANSLAISGNYAIVGAYLEDDNIEPWPNGLNSGKAYIFNVTTGALLYTLANPNPYGTAQNDRFGVSVAISGNYAIVGSDREGESGETNVGKAYIFNVTTGALVHTIDYPDTTEDYAVTRSDIWFGSAVSISGNYAIVGAYSKDYSAGVINSGIAFIFNVTTGALVHKLINPNAYGAYTNDNFGLSVAISGDYAIVGAEREDDADGTDSGKAYIFNVTTGALVQTLDNPNPYGTSLNDRFTAEIDMSGNYVIFGNNAEDAGGTNAGIAYIYKLSPT
jgi:hypothetical protein